MKFRAQSAIVMLLSVPALSHAMDLKPQTLQAWDDYIHAAKVHMEDRAHGKGPFLWVDQIPELAGRVRAGEIPVEPANGESPLGEPGGLIHDWVGAVFIPKAKLDDVMSVLDDYAHYQDIYNSMVVRSKLLDGMQNREKVSLVMVQKAYGVTAAVETDNDVDIVRPSADRAYSFSASVRVQEIADFGESTEHTLPVNQGHGYVWRMFTISRVEQRDGGVYLEMELMGLSRSIPWVFRWLVQPLAEHLPRAILRSILDDTRDAVNEKVKAAKSMTPGTNDSAESFPQFFENRISGPSL